MHQIPPSAIKTKAAEERKGAKKKLKTWAGGGGAEEQGKVVLMRPKAMGYWVPLRADKGAPGSQRGMLAVHVIPTTHEEAS